MTAATTGRRAALVVLAAGGLAGAFRAGGWVAGQAPVPSAPAAFKPEDPPYRGLDANLYMQTSAEYRAACYQAYNLAMLRLKEALAKKPAGKPAVVMDLDETVVDNAGFQAQQLRSNLAYDQRLWDLWEENDGARVGLVPGAKEFILGAREQGVTVAYISNRGHKYHAQTKKVLERLGVPAESDELLKLATDTSNKTKRRQEVEAAYTVLMLVGDNLRDFDEEFVTPKLEGRTPEELEKAIRARKEAVDRRRAVWGDRYIVLPNPAYGEWTKPLSGGKADLDRLAPAVAPAP